MATATRVARNRGHLGDVSRFDYERGRRFWDLEETARRAGVSRWCLWRLRGGHRVDRRSLQKIAKAFADAPVTDGGLLLAPSQLEELGK